MKRSLRLGILLAAVAAAGVVGGVLFATQPWHGEEAAAQTITYRLCNVTLKGPPPPSLVDRRKAKLPAGTVLIQGSRGYLGVDLYGPRRSYAGVNATTGEVGDESYATASEEAILKGILATVRLEPFDPASAPWPYTAATQVPPERQQDEGIEYRWPDPGAGLTVSWMYSRPTTPRDDYGFVVLSSCRSRSHMYVGTSTGTVAQQLTSIDPVDATAFQNFLQEVKIVK